MSNNVSWFVLIIKKLQGLLKKMFNNLLFLETILEIIDRNMISGWKIVEYKNLIKINETKIAS